MNHIPSHLIRTKSDKVAIEQGCYYDDKKSNKVRVFCEKFCRQSKGRWSGQPITLFPWQHTIIDALFGWMNKDGLRRHRRATLYLPKKQGKSTFLSAITLYMLLEEPGAECYIAATTCNQAQAIYGESVEMVRCSNALSSLLTPVPTPKVIRYEANKSRLKVLSIDQPNRIPSANSSFVALDEIGGWASRGRVSYDYFTQSTYSRTQPLIISISHAYYERDSIGYELYLEAKEVLDGKRIDTQLFPMVYESYKQWDTEEAWYEAMPSLGHTITPDTIKAECERAKGNTRLEVAFRTNVLNQWCFGGETPWILNEDWQACYEDFDEDIFFNCEVYGGYDMARKHDIASICYITVRDGLYYITTRCFTSETTARLRERKNEGRYTQWAMDTKNNLILCKGDLIRDSDVRQQVLDDHQKMHIVEMRYDANNGAAMSLCHEQLCEDDGLPMVSVPYNFSQLDRSTVFLDNLISSRKIRHNGNPIIEWMVSNARVKTNSHGQCLPDKIKSQGRIDGVSAMVLALSACLGGVNEFDASDIMVW